jgi:hypothetical protein
MMNNTSSTTICSNRRQGELLLSGKKNPNLYNFNNGDNDGYNIFNSGQGGEISSDRQTLRMNDFLKQMEAYSNE